MVNIILAGDGDDILVAHVNTLGSRIFRGNSGNDTLIGGDGSQLFGDEDDDLLLAYQGAAKLMGGTGNDVLTNSYPSMVSPTNPLGQSVVMSGGSGNDIFGLIGTNNASAMGEMNTIIADVETGDGIDLSFLV
jgi:serralysin